MRSYCRNVAETADWGGHPELLALTKVLRCPIRVHSADAPPLVMGWEEYSSGAPAASTSASPPPLLELTFHRHFYALGEHYNSTAPR